MSVLNFVTEFSDGREVYGPYIPTITPPPYPSPNVPVDPTTNQPVPLRVDGKFDDVSISAAITGEALHEVEQALETWSLATELVFELIPTLARPGINFEYGDTDVHLTGQFGATEVNSRGSYLTHNQVTLQSTTEQFQYPFNNQNTGLPEYYSYPQVPLPDGRVEYGLDSNGNISIGANSRTVYEVALGAIGKAVGIGTNSTDPNSIEYPYTTSTTLDATDIANAKALYPTLAPNDLQIPSAGAQLFIGSTSEEVDASASNLSLIIGTGKTSLEIVNFATSQGSVIDLVRGTGGLFTMAQVSAALHSDPYGNTILNLGTQGSIKFDHITPLQFTSHDFLFVSAQGQSES